MGRQPTVHLVSLGCPKNKVDSEVMLGYLVRSGYQVVDSAELAEVIVVNTCGFIDAAKEESIDQILEMVQIRSQGLCKKLLVSGCLSQRYASELAAEIPEVDHFLGTGNFQTVVEVLNDTRDQRNRSLPLVGETNQRKSIPAPKQQDPQATAIARDPNSPLQRDGAATPPQRVSISSPEFSIHAGSPRLHTQPPHSVYVKISEGCSNTCAFCVIPAIRGPQRSRSIADVVSEVRTLAARGAVEINLIAQNLCAYGKDHQPRQSLAKLLRDLNEVGERLEGPLWIRCLYAYPTGLTLEVMEVMANSSQVVPYLDIPLQHISDRILRRMRRGKGGPRTRQLISHLRQTLPEMSLRTAFIVGLPGESEKDFLELCDFVREVRFEHVGVFTYSKEEDTPAAGMPGHVGVEVAQERRDCLMEIQRNISREQQQGLVGKTLSVLVDGVSEETDLLLQGRHPGQAPDVDGVTYINAGTASPGDLVRVTIDQAHDYDLVGGIVS